MSESELVTYYYEQAVHLSQVAIALLLAAVILAILSFVFAGLYGKAARERSELRDELSRHHDADHQLTLIHDLGEAGRREVRRLAQEAHQELHGIVVRAEGGNQ